VLTPLKGIYDLLFLVNLSLEHYDLTIAFLLHIDSEIIPKKTKKKMEVIGATASIIQILDVALRITEALIRYGNDTKNASREKKVLVEETVSLAAILENLKEYAQSNIHDPTWLESRKDIVRQFQRAYQELATSLQLDIFTGKQKPETKLQAIRAAVKWSFGKSEVYALVERITRLQHYSTTLMIGDQGHVIPIHFLFYHA